MFIIPSNQYVRLTKWKNAHTLVCSYRGTSAVDESITYQFTPTPLGMIIKVRCSCTLRDSIDLSEYESW